LFINRFIGKLKNNKAAGIWNMQRFQDLKKAGGGIGEGKEEKR